MKKKVCIIHKVSTLDPRSFYKEGRTLFNAGYDVNILGLFKSTRNENGINLIGFNASKSRFTRFLMTNYQIFRRALREKADVYHFHDLDFIPWAVFLKIFTRSKIIYDIHEAYPEYILLKTYIPEPFRKAISFFVYLMEHGAIKMFDAIIPNDNFVSRGFRHKNNIVIFNFPTLDFFRNKNGSKWQERKYDIFYHGTLPRYHFERMMNIAEKLNAENIRNRWGIVTKDAQIINWATAETEKRKLTSNFDFLPYTDYLNVIDYLNVSKIGIIPLPPYKKFMKNIPLKMFEFMGCGLPIVLSDLPPSRQFIEDKDCAIAVEPDNIDEYANAIKLLLNNQGKAVEMGERGKKLIYEKYNWNVEEKKLLELYKQLLPS
ncbi:MAG: glycosyltransferase family 4 protein [Nitrospirae bacterium]|nr:glycosyltransferase family 4 protein [Nitrospirota bacterium]